nr:phenylalanine--tRNA ligase subunit beta [Maliibacterium massiliense]
MNVPLSWLKQYVVIPEDISVQAYSDAMIMSGSEVEGYEQLGRDIDRVVVGQVTCMARHQNSDHLWVCQVDVGQGEDVQIVTGAQNVTVGAKVPVALDGATLPGDVHIKKGKLRGEASWGMLCSGAELNADAQRFPASAVDGIWLLAQDLPVGTDMRDVLGVNDTIIEFKTLANRPDCMSMVGIARETAVTLGTALMLPAVHVRQSGDDIQRYLSVTIQDAKLCPRYSARVVKNIRIAPSPDWMQKALIGCGVRPINNVVDITNYVMLEMGQPMHAFDYACVRGGKITVRPAQAGECIRTLDGKERALEAGMLAICDAEGPIALAGVMGGENSEITEATQMVVLESAHFDGASIRTTSRALGMRTEASARFEKGVYDAGVALALERAAQLFELLDAGDVVSGVVDVYPNPEPPKTFTVSVQKINALLGVEIPAERMCQILEALFFGVEHQGDAITVTVPDWRGDVEGMADIAEEVLRIYGYDKIPSTLMEGGLMTGGRSAAQRAALKIKDFLCGKGLQEITTYSFITPRWLDALRMPADDPKRNVMRILNPLGEELSVMRTEMLPSVLQVMAVNLNRGNAQVSLFETGRVYLPKGADALAQQPDEVKRLCIASNVGDFFDMKGIVEALFDALGAGEGQYKAGGAQMWHPGRKAEIYCQGKLVGEIGEVHPDTLEAFGISERVYAADLDMEALIALCNEDRRYVALPRMPAVTRDLAVVVEESVAVGDMLGAIRRAGGALLERAQVFDIYRGDHVAPDSKSVAFTLVLRAADHTLTDDEVKKLFDKTVRSLGAQFGAALRA